MKHYYVVYSCSNSTKGALDVSFEHGINNWDDVQSLRSLIEKDIPGAIDVLILSWREY